MDAFVKCNNFAIQCGHRDYIFHHISRFHSSATIRTTLISRTLNRIQDKYNNLSGMSPKRMFKLRGASKFQCDESYGDRGAIEKKRAETTNK